jgi:CBS domain-containing protein
MASDLPVEGEHRPETRAGAVADRAVATCGLGELMADVTGRLAGATLCVVVEDGLVMGLLEDDALADAGADGTKTAAEAMRSGPSTFRPSVPRQELAAYLDDHDLGRAILSTLDGRLVGVVSRADLDG